MNLIIIHKNFAESQGLSFLKLIATSTPMAQMALNRFSRMILLDSDSSPSLVLPQSCTSMIKLADIHFRYYDDQAMSLQLNAQERYRKNGWSVISNGQFFTNLDQQWVLKNLTNIEADIVAIHVDPELNASREKVRFTSESTIAGFRHLYAASAHLAETPKNWPHHLLVKSNVLQRLLDRNRLPLDFQTIRSLSHELKLRWRTLRFGGTLLDLSHDTDLLNFFRGDLEQSSESETVDDPAMKTIHPTARLFGRVQIGQNVTIEKNALIIGPTLIDHDVTICEGAVVRDSIITARCRVNSGQRIENRIVFGDEDSPVKIDVKPDLFFQHYLISASINQSDGQVNNFRRWSGFGYANHLKRWADVGAAIGVLLLFAPVLPLIALVIKLTSKGPIFFGHNRQGLHGKEFKCWKFRTMLVGADDLQAALRARNEVDGPQFKMDNDPRINGVGHFLRETCLDEIPQFFNVLLGQMSVVGPRPSPEKENSLCPPWRDARLSVRPGLTGLWQICRTREQSQDFQEWVYYDTQYVKNLSWKKDLWICFATVKELAVRFVNQF